MITFGAVQQSTDRKGNAYVAPLQRNGKLVVLVGSSRLRFSPGTLVEYYPAHLKEGERVLFADSFFSSDFAFYDVDTEDLLVVGRSSPHAFCVEPYAFYQRTRGLWSQSGIIEETEPRLEYFHARNFRLPDNPIQELSRLLGIPKNPGIRVVQGVVPGKDVDSLLSVPHGPVPDRQTLGKFLQRHLDTIVRR
jgi:hypothetical protein